MAYILKGRTKGSWSFSLELGRDLKGKRIRKMITVKGTKKDAEIRMAEMLRLTHRGEYITPSQMTVADYLRKWDRDFVSIEVADTTAQVYRQRMYTEFIPSFGHIRLNELRESDLMKYFRNLHKKGLSARTLFTHLMTLKSMFRWAIKEGDLAKAPTEKISASKGIFKWTKKEFQILEPHEVKLVLDVAKQWYPIYHPAIYLDMYTGLRRSELFGLTWADIDWDKKQIDVNKTLHYLNRQFITGAPKNDTSRRKVSIGDPELNVLKEYKEWLQDKEQQLGIKVTEDSNYIFRNEELKPMIPSSLYTPFQKLIKQSGITKHIRFHDVRHTHASLLVHKDINFKIIQKRMGHASITTTLDLYAHLMKGDDEVASQAIHELMASVS
jgi:integrase